MRAIIYENLRPREEKRYFECSLAALFNYLVELIKVIRSPSQPQGKVKNTVLTVIEPQVECTIG